MKYLIEFIQRFRSGSSIICIFPVIVFKVRHNVFNRLKLKRFRQIYVAIVPFRYSCRKDKRQIDHKPEKDKSHLLSFNLTKRKRLDMGKYKFRAFIASFLIIISKAKKFMSAIGLLCVIEENRNLSCRQTSLEKFYV